MIELNSEDTMNSHIKGVKVVYKKTHHWLLVRDSIYNMQHMKKQLAQNQQIEESIQKGK